MINRGKLLFIFEGNLRKNVFSFIFGYIFTMNLSPEGLRFYVKNFVKKIW